MSSDGDGKELNVEEEVTFDNTTTAAAPATAEEVKLQAAVAAEAQEELFANDEKPTSNSPSSEYEIVESADGEEEVSDDGEMDELEAEIARELNDL
jgi:hypothetical protein